VSARIKETIAGHPGNWTCGDIQAALGVSWSPVKRVVDQMLAAGLVRRIGVAPTGGRGRPAHVYRCESARQ
jgi:predicted ArsR family transcriptional regulator